MRKLSDFFINELTNGSLSSLLSYVERDNTLDLNIRENYINIYYRGGNALKVVSQKDVDLFYEFDKNYINGGLYNTHQLIDLALKQLDWNNYFPLVKQVMDFYFTQNQKEEREYQQLVVRENNYSSVANGTDYFIIDIEYDNHKNARFDLVALYWPSEASIRKLLNNFKPRIVIIEMKYGDGAIRGSAGIYKHCEDFQKFRQSDEDVKDFKLEMLEIFKQKRLLGLIPCLGKNGNYNMISEVDSEIDLLFLIANHDPASKILLEEIQKIQSFNTKFILSNYCGYGIYQDSILSLNSFIYRYSTGIEK